jgi:hypothetical protein
MDAAFTNEPPTLADMEMVRAKINELIFALRRYWVLLGRCAGTIPASGNGRI